jgi:predicted kinase
MIVIVFGLPGSGKTYFAGRLADRINAEHIQSDKMRKELLDASTYSDREKLYVYDEMMIRSKNCIKQNKNVVIDATFYHDEIRKKFLQEIPEIFFIEVRADESLICERLKRKRAYSDADFQAYKKIKSEWQPMGEQHLILQSTDDNIEEMLHKASTSLLF